MKAEWYDIGRPAVMAIVNVTPDSFYAESRAFTAERLGGRIREAIDEGADVLDVGGCSTRPGAGAVSECEEIDRVLRAVETVRQVSGEIPISIDTFRSEVVRRVVQAVGRVTVNDVTGGEADPRLADLAAEYDLPYVVMHMRGTPQTMASLTDYTDVVGEVRSWLLRRAGELRRRGVRRLILDPGFGFAKTLEQNHALLGGLHRICAAGYPVLAALSRKSMIYKAINVVPEEALAGTEALNWEALRQGAAVLRVHDVKEAAQMVRLYEIYRKNCQ